MMKRALIVLCVALGVLGGSAIGGYAALAATEQLDQQYTATPDDYGYVNDNWGWEQTYTAGATGNLDRVSLYLTRESSIPGQDLHVSIYNTSGGAPTGSPLATSTLATASTSLPVSSYPTPISCSWIDVPLSNVPQTAGSQYAIVLSSGASGPGWAWCGTAADGYAGGQSEYDSFGGSTWNVTAPEFSDLNFKTYVIPSAGAVTVAGTARSCSVLTSCSGQVATITDTDGDACTNYAATIAWGDGTSSPGTVRATNSSTACAVIGTHTYSLPGTYTMTVNVTDSDGTTGGRTGTVTVAQPTAKSLCKNGVCPSARASLNSGGVSSSFRVSEGTNGALSGTLQYSDTTSPSAAIPSCFTGSVSCNFAVSSLTCSGTTAQTYGTVKVNTVMRYVHLTLSGTATTTGSFTVQQSWTGGSYSKTVSGYGIVSIICP